MNKIINGKRYDTETAAKVYEWDNGGSWRDFNHVEEQLFRKRTGEYFLHGEGGPLSAYCVYEGTNTRTGGEKIIPLTLDKAKAWAEKHMTADEFESEFGPVETGDVIINITISAAAADALTQAALDGGVSRKELIRQIIYRHLSEV